MASTNLGPPLVAYSGLGYCDAKHQHELVLVTNGAVAVAYGRQSATVSRRGSLFTVHCHEIIDTARSGCSLLCPGEVVFDISDDTMHGRGWASDAEQLALLECPGVRVDV